MKINEVLRKLEKYAPLELSDRLIKQIGGYDNVGIIAQIEGEITGIVFTLDLTDKSIDKALETGANLIVTHHPAIFNPPLKLDYEKSPLLRCLNCKIGVISMHLNLDCAEKGIDYYLAKGLGAEKQEIIYQVDKNCGYGRIFETSTTLSEIKEKYQTEFLTDKVMIFGHSDRAIEKVASYCGAGLDDTAIETITDVDLYVSADIKHHVILSALKRGKCVMQVTHYSSEMYGFREFYNSVKENLCGVNTCIVENEFML
ncbi:MAG: Nif3-like dinuclear metal center hexameric protein [Clostridiales bacterium]|nr:Nif3-like dinuclear metal center hexameric protein [Clostridiales bacterium]